MDTDIQTGGACGICGSDRSLERHHILPRRMGGSSNPAVHDGRNLITLCRGCHTNLHEGRWTLERLTNGLRVLDAVSGKQIMRRLESHDVDVPGLLHLLEHAASSIACLLDGLPFFSDEQLVAAFGQSRAFGKRAWLVQAAILHEAQARSIHGDEALAGVARRFDVSLRQAEKYAAVWRTFFSEQHGDTEGVNIDEFALDEPSWYLVAASETREPHVWLSYAQDRKLEDPRYTVAALRRDIRASRLQESIGTARHARHISDQTELDRWSCPWVSIYCTRSGMPQPVPSCVACVDRSEGGTSQSLGGS